MTTDQPPATRRRIGPLSDRQWVIMGVAAVVAVLVLAAVAAVTLRLSRAAAHEVSAPAGDRRGATFVLFAGGVTDVTVRAADIGDNLYRIATPAGSAAVPRATVRDGTVQLRLTGGASGVTVRLSSRVRWAVRLAAGLTRALIDLSGGSVSRVDFASGLDTVDMRLPAPGGRVPVRVGGGANQVTVHLPPRVPAQVRLGSGAGSVTLDGTSHTGVAGGTVYALAGYSGTGDGYAIDMASGVATLVVRRD